MLLGLFTQSKCCIPKREEVLFIWVWPCCFLRNFLANQYTSLREVNLSQSENPWHEVVNFNQGEGAFVKSVLGSVSLAAMRVLARKE